jgi:hypothetical protein
MLRAALQKGQSAAPTAPAVDAAKSDLSSFPCIQEGQPLQDDVAASFEQLNLSKTQLVGSMPTRTLSGSVGSPPARLLACDRLLHTAGTAPLGLLGPVAGRLQMP